MTVDGHTLWFSYDAHGPMYVKCDGTTYLYVTNLQGDIIAIVNNDGTAVVEYTYDAWGNILSTSGSLKNTLGVYNPLRYRGYVYDTESRLYYLQSRYYDPEMGRFINADALVSTGQGVLGCNMFAYCANSPIVNSDPYGYCTCALSGLEKNFAYAGFCPNCGSCGGGAGAGSGGILGLALWQFTIFAAELSRDIVQTFRKVLESSAPGEEYTVYFLCEAGDASREIIYVGRVKTSNFQSRMTYHNRMGREYVSSISGLDYNLCRALEQAGMVYYHTLNSQSLRRNKIRGISPTNPKRFDYMAALWDIVNRSLFPEYSFLPLEYIANLAENEFLNGGM